MKPIIVVGAGWAGLSAALSLAKQGKKVLVLEAGHAPGGRARALTRKFTQALRSGDDKALGDYPFPYDNGQHLFIGGYQKIISILRDLNIEESQVFKREAFNLLLHRKKNNIKLRTYPGLPHPLPLLMGGLLATGFTLFEKFSLLRFFGHLKNPKFQIPQDMTIKSLLIHLKQPHSLIECLFEPLALAALSTPIEEGSAQIFFNVLRNTFNLKKGYSDFLFPKTDLSTLFPGPAIKYLESAGHTVLFRQRVLELVLENGQCLGVITEHQRWESSGVILAVPPYSAVKILTQSYGHISHTTKTSPDRLISLIQSLNQFKYHPITTLYLHFSKLPNFPSPLMGFSGGIIQWVFDHSNIKHENKNESENGPLNESESYNKNDPCHRYTQTLSIVITGQGAHSEWAPESLVQKAIQELRSYYPSLRDPLDYKVITEKRAAFSCTPHIISKRPSSHTQLPGLWLAGDYLDTGLPATLEAAVQTGMDASELILLKN